MPLTDYYDVGARYHRRKLARIALLKVSSLIVAQDNG